MGSIQSAFESWNKIQKQFKNMFLKDLSPNKIEIVLSNFYLKSLHVFKGVYTLTILKIKFKL